MHKSKETARKSKQPSLNPDVLISGKHLRVNPKGEVIITYTFNTNTLENNSLFSRFKCTKESAFSEQEKEITRNAMQSWKKALTEKGLAVRFIEKDDIKFAETVRDGGKIANPLWLFKQGQYVTVDETKRKVNVQGDLFGTESGTTSTVPSPLDNQLVDITVIRITKDLKLNHLRYVLLHELGHLFGLEHGEPAEAKDKEPHFPKEYQQVDFSIMNYGNPLLTDCLRDLRGTREKPKTITQEDVHNCLDTTYPTELKEIDIKAVTKIYNKHINKPIKPTLDGCDPKARACYTDNNSHVHRHLRLSSSDQNMTISPNWKNILTSNLALTQFLAHTLADRMKQKQEGNLVTPPNMNQTTTLPDLSWLEKYSQQKQHQHDLQKQYKELESRLEIVRESYKTRFDASTLRQDRTNLLKQFSKKYNTIVNDFIKSQQIEKNSSHPTLPDYLSKGGLYRS